MKHKITTIFIRCSALLISLTQGCGSTTATPTPAATPGPSGRYFSGDIKLFDGAPSLSSDGLKLAFESGRSKTGDDYRLRIFKVTIDSDPNQPTGAPSRLTDNDDLISETSPVMSSDGNNVTFIGGTSTGSRGVYITPWAGGTTTKFSTDGEQVYSQGISPDSTLIAYAAIDSTTGSSSVIVVDAGNSATRATLATGSRKISGLRWLRAGAGYKLATVSLAESSGASVTRIEAWTFANIAGVASASASTLTEKSVMASSDDAARWIAQDGTKILTVQRLTPASTRSVGEVGAGALADRQIYVRNDLLLLDPNTAAESQMDSAVASAITGISASTSATILTGNETARCISGSLPSKITTMKLSATPAVATSYERIVVRKTSSELTFDVINDPCDTTLTGDGVLLDTAPGDLVLSDGATTSTLSAAYVSVITGDPEVIVIRRASGTTKAWDASSNIKK